MSLIPFLMLSSLAYPPPGRIRNNFLTNLLTYSCLYWNTGSPICFAQRYSQRHKKVHPQGQPRPLHKSLKSENLECNSTNHTKSLEASSISLKDTKVIQVLMPVIQRRKRAD